MKDRVIQFLRIVPAAFLLASCHSPATVKIGLLTTFSGSSIEMSRAAQNAAFLCIDEVNNQGGINGREVELLVRDDRGTEDGAREGASFLIDEGATVIVGAYISALTAAALEVCNREGVLLFSPGAASSAFDNLDDMLFRLYTPAVENGARYAERIIERYGFRRVVCLRDVSNPVYTSQWARGFEERFTALGGNLFKEISLDSRENYSFSEIAHRALDVEPEAVIFVTDGFTAAALAQQVKKLNPIVQLFAAEWAGASRELIILGGQAVNGLELLYVFDPDDPRPESMLFTESYRDRFGRDPISLSLITYEAIRIILHGVADRSDGETLAAAILRGNPYKGLQWDIEFNAFGDGEMTPSFFIIQDGTYISHP